MTTGIFSFVRLDAKLSTCFYTYIRQRWMVLRSLDSECAFVRIHKIRYNNKKKLYVQSWTWPLGYHDQGWSSMLSTCENTLSRQRWISFFFALSVNALESLYLRYSGGKGNGILWNNCFFSRREPFAKKSCILGQINDTDFFL